MHNRGIGGGEHVVGTLPLDFTELAGRTEHNGVGIESLGLDGLELLRLGVDESTETVVGDNLHLRHGQGLDVTVEVGIGHDILGEVVGVDGAVLPEGDAGLGVGMGLEDFPLGSAHTEHARGRVARDDAHTPTVVVHILQVAEGLRVGAAPSVLGAVLVLAEPEAAALLAVLRDGVQVNLETDDAAAAGGLRGHVGTLGLHLEAGEGTLAVDALEELDGVHHELVVEGIVDIDTLTSEHLHLLVSVDVVGYAASHTRDFAGLLGEAVGREQRTFRLVGEVGGHDGNAALANLLVEGTGGVLERSESVNGLPLLLVEPVVRLLGNPVFERLVAASEDTRFEELVEIGRIQTGNEFLRHKSILL